MGIWPKKKKKSDSDVDPERGTPSEASQADTGPQQGSTAAAEGEPMPVGGPPPTDAGGTGYEATRDALAEERASTRSPSASEPTRKEAGRGESSGAEQPMQAQQGAQPDLNAVYRRLDELDRRLRDLEVDRQLRVLGELPEALTDEERLAEKLRRDQHRLLALVNYVRHEGDRKAFLHEYFGLPYQG